MRIDGDSAIAFLRYRGVLSLYCASKWDFILDKQKWNAAWLARGLPEDDHSKRFGIVVLDETTVKDFVRQASSFLVDAATLRTELKAKLSRTNSWWEVEEIFPKLLIDFDQRKLTACYDLDSNPRWEEYVPQGWVGEFADFMRPPNDYGIDASLLYWIFDGRNVLDQLEV